MNRQMIQIWFPRVLKSKLWLQGPLQKQNIGPWAHTTSELLWLEWLLAELRIKYFSHTLLGDNLSNVLLSHNPILHARTKHIELDIHFVRERVMANKLKIQHVPAPTQLADIIIKPLSNATFQDLRNKLKVVLLPPHWPCGRSIKDIFLSLT